MKINILRWAGIATIMLVGSSIGGAVWMAWRADAARNSSGTMSKLYTFTPGSTINSTNMNWQFSDFESEMTDSLSRSGKGGMSAALRGTDGTVAAPAFSFTSETGTGFYRIGSSDLGCAISGVKKLELTGTLFTVTPDISFTGSLTSNLTLSASSPVISASASNSPLILKGNASAADTGVDIALRAAANRSAGDIVRVQTNNGATDVLKIGYNGALTIGSAGAAIGAIKKATVAWDPAATGAGGCAGGQTVNITNVAVGDLCWAAAGASVGSAWTTCQVNTAGQVTVNVCAFTNTDVSSSTWNVWTLQATN